MLDFIGNVFREFVFRASDRNLSSKLLCLVIITTSLRIDREEISVSVSISRKIGCGFHDPLDVGSTGGSPNTENRVWPFSRRPRNDSLLLRGFCHSIDRHIDDHRRFQRLGDCPFTTMEQEF